MREIKAELEKKLGDELTGFQPDEGAVLAFLRTRLKGGAEASASLRRNGSRAAHVAGLARE